LSGDVRELLGRDRGRDAASRGVPAARQDPAFGSGPLPTVVQDLLSIAVYVAIVSALMP
jgi:hypothetical protein